MPTPLEHDRRRSPLIAFWRKVLWSTLAVLVVAPLGWTAGVLGLDLALQFSLPSRLAVSDTTMRFIVPSVLALAGVVPVVGTGLRRGWPGRNHQLIGLGAGAVVSLGGLVAVLLVFQPMSLSSKLRRMLPSQPAAGVDQFFREHPERIFLRYDELVGPNRYLRSYSARDGEDLSGQFPVRRDWCTPTPVRLPDGTTVQRGEVLAAIGKSGLIATYPRPQGDQYDPKRIYRLDGGGSFRGDRVVNLPPDPAGREGRDQDGVHTYFLPDGRRFEINYRGGVPDGAFRAFHADGAPWGEAMYRRGRVVSAWLLTRDGRKFDELKDGEAAQSAVSRSLDAASLGARSRGLQKLGAKDHVGAIVDLTDALAVHPRDAELLRARGDAHRATGDLDRAIDDYGAAEGFRPEQLGEYRMPEALRELVLERGHRRQQAGDAAGAARDFAAFGREAERAATDCLRRQDQPGAVRILSAAIAVAPTAELLAARADARRTLSGQEGSAVSDYTDAIELARQGKMQIAANQRFLASQWHYKRGHVRRWLQDFGGAAEDFRLAYLSLGSGSLIQRSDAALWRFLVQSEAGHRAEAGRELQRTDRASWRPASRDTARFLLGEITEAKLEAVLQENNQEGDWQKAELLAGLLRRLAGDEAGALERIRRASARSTRETIERDAARLALEGR
jgi:tetratricopeptide (TPR) repeat protein